MGDQLVGWVESLDVGYVGGVDVGLVIVDQGDGSGVIDIRLSIKAAQCVIGQRVG